MKQRVVFLAYIALIVVAGCSNGASRSIPATGKSTHTSAAGAPASFPSMTNPTDPVPGTGTGGAEGPFIGTALRNLPDSGAPAGWQSSHADDDHFVGDPNVSDYGVQPALLPAPNEATITPSPTSSSTLRSQARLRGTGQRPLDISASSGFTTDGDIDMPGATNGTYIVSFENGNFNVYTTSGALIKRIGPNPAFYCGPLPICADGGFNVDNRVAYDTGANRWITSGLVIDTNVATVVTDVLAVSQTSDPTGAWNYYQFPACGSNYPIDKNHIGDQPHLGFNSQWVIVDTACSAGYPSLAVFDKNALYSGATLALNANWFEFVDPVAAYNKDNPVLTYAPTINNREYLTASVSGTCATLQGVQCADVLYSHLEGVTDSPVFYPSTDQVDTDYQFSDFNYQTLFLNTPSCSNCFTAWSADWAHSSSVWAFKNGQTYILSTAVVGDPRYSNATQVVNIATSDAGVATAMRIVGGTGSGPLASEIAMPLVPNLSNDTAIVAYDWSSSSFFPGVWASQWDVDLNIVDFTNALAQGTVAPPAGDFYQHRWSDFIDAFSPIPGTSNMLLGAQFGTPSASSPYAASFWTTVTEGATPTPAPTSTPEHTPPPCRRPPCPQIIVKGTPSP